VAGGVLLGGAVGAGASSAYLGSTAKDKFEAWRRERERDQDALIARMREFEDTDDSSSESDEDTDTIAEWGYNDWNGGYGDTDMDQSSSSESDEDTDKIVKWGYNDWNGWRQEQGMLCRTDEDCWMDSNLACARNDMDFEVDHKWFGGDWAKIIGQCECTVGQWDQEQLQCQQMAEEEEEEVRPSGGFWGSARSTAADRRKNRTGRKTKPGFFAGTAGILVIVLIVGTGICCFLGIYAKLCKTG